MDQKADRPNTSGVPSSSTDRYTTAVPAAMNVVGISLDLKSDEAEQVSKLFCQEFCKHTDDKGKARFPSSIGRIVRVYNTDLWVRYCRQKYRMQQTQEGGIEVNEWRLFHGTAPENIDSICKYGFLIDHPIVNGRSLGNGHYVTPDRCMAHHFTREACDSEEPAIVASALAEIPIEESRQRSSKEDADEDRDATMTQSVDSTAAAAAVATEPRDKIRLRHYTLLCAVLTGRSEKVGSIYEKPLMLNLGSYDSAYRKAPYGEEYVVYNDSQVYPEYVIEYWSEKAWGVT